MTRNKHKGLNLENTNFKSDIFNKNKNLRDYDENPLIIKNYEILYQQLIFICPLIFSLVIAFNVFMIFDSGALEIKSIIFGIFLLSVFIILFFNNDKSKNNLIYFKNDFIEFIDNRISKKTSDDNSLNKFICKSVSEFGLENEKINFDTKIVFYFLGAIFILNIIVGSDSKTAMVGNILFILSFFLSFILGNYLTKIILAFLLSKSGDRYISIYQAIIIDKPFFKDLNVLPKMFKIHQPARYYMIINFSKVEYMQIKEWFLTRKNINIDNIKKSYLPL